MMNDLISRQEAIDALADMHCKSDEDGYVWIIRSDAWARIDALPSAQPERKTGKWKLYGMIYYCSECGHYCEQGGNNFCGNCGAYMRGDNNE